MSPDTCGDDVGHVPTTVRCRLPSGWRLVDLGSAEVDVHGWDPTRAADLGDGVPGDDPAGTSTASRRRAARMGRAGVVLFATTGPADHQGEVAADRGGRPRVRASLRLAVRRLAPDAVVTGPMARAALAADLGAVPAGARPIGEVEDAVLGGWTAVRRACLLRVPADPAGTSPPGLSPPQPDRAVARDRILLIGDRHLLVADFTTPDLDLLGALRGVFAGIAATVEVVEAAAA